MSELSAEIADSLLKAVVRDDSSAVKAIYENYIHKDRFKDIKKTSCRIAARRIEEMKFFEFVYSSCFEHMRKNVYMFFMPNRRYSNNFQLFLGHKFTEYGFRASFAKFRVFLQYETKSETLILILYLLIAKNDQHQRLDKTQVDFILDTFWQSSNNQPEDISLRKGVMYDLLSSYINDFELKQYIMEHVLRKVSMIETGHDGLYCEVRLMRLSATSRQNFCLQQITYLLDNATIERPPQDGSFDLLCLLGRANEPDKRYSIIETIRCFYAYRHLGFFSKNIDEALMRNYFDGLLHNYNASRSMKLYMNAREVIWKVLNASGISPKTEIEKEIVVSFKHKSIIFLKHVFDNSLLCDDVARLIFYYI